MGLDVYVEYEIDGNTVELYTARITHNLGTMAEHAGLYEYLWRPDECGITTAQQLIAPLEQGLALLEASPATYETFNPENGWGGYDDLVEFVRDYLAECKKFPSAKVRVWR